MCLPTPTCYDDDPDYEADPLTITAALQIIMERESLAC